MANRPPVEQSASVPEIPANIVLKQFDAVEVEANGDTSRVLDLWDALRQTSVDVAKTQTSVFDFAILPECLYLAVILDSSLFVPVVHQSRESDTPSHTQQRQAPIPFDELARARVEKTGNQDDEDIDLEKALNWASNLHSVPIAGPSFPSYTPFISEETLEGGFGSPSAQTQEYREALWDVAGSRLVSSRKIKPLKKTRKTPTTSNSLKTKPNLVGLAFVITSAHAEREAGIGLILNEEYRGKGHGRTVLLKLLRFAFDEFGFHRVHASVMHNTDRDIASATKLFIGMGFQNEGTRRMAAVHPVDGVWRDTKEFGILDMDWYNLQMDQMSGKETKQTIWDEMLGRHQKEREDMLRCDGGYPLKRTNSSETLKPQVEYVVESAYETTSESDAGSGYHSSQSVTRGPSVEPREEMYLFGDLGARPDSPLLGYINEQEDSPFSDFRRVSPTYHTDTDNEIESSASDAESSASEYVPRSSRKGKESIRLAKTMERLRFNSGAQYRRDALDSSDSDSDSELDYTSCDDIAQGGRPASHGEGSGNQKFELPELTKLDDPRAMKRRKTEIIFAEHDEKGEAIALAENPEESSSMVQLPSQSQAEERDEYMSESDYDSEISSEMTWEVVSDASGSRFSPTIENAFDSDFD